MSDEPTHPEIARLMNDMAYIVQKWEKMFTDLRRERNTLLKANEHLRAQLLESHKNAEAWVTRLAERGLEPAPADSIGGVEP